MLTLILTIMAIAFAARVALYGVKLAWGLGSLLAAVFMPLLLVWALAIGLLRFAWPVLLITALLLFVRSLRAGRA